MRNKDTISLDDIQMAIESLKVKLYEPQPRLLYFVPESVAELLIEAYGILPEGFAIAKPWPDDIWID